MKTLVLCSLLLFALQSCMAQNNSSAWQDPEVSPQIYGSYDSLATAIADQTIAPPGCDGGKVFVKFLVDKKGEVKEPKIVKGICSQTDKIALTIVETIRFRPGLYKGKPIPSYRILPIDFQ